MGVGSKLRLTVALGAVGSHEWVLTGGHGKARMAPPASLTFATLFGREPPRYPSVACEILTSDVPQINDALGADESLLNRLYGFLQSSGSLNPLLASFFSKVMGILINRKTDQVRRTRARVVGRRAGARALLGRLSDEPDEPDERCPSGPQLVSFLRKKDDFVDLLLQHIGTSAIMDLLLRLLTCVERPQLRQDVVNVSVGAGPAGRGWGLPEVGGPVSRAPLLLAPSGSMRRRSCSGSLIRSTRQRMTM